MSVRRGTSNVPGSVLIHRSPKMVRIYHQFGYTAQFTSASTISTVCGEKAPSG
ncbi:hypothetical protein [Paenibacillus mucilaginosus]|uniref:hypothetical protein n=1 Tax=Paenibacillus mucilaginosus TaxID=61624 RepID=UPI003D196A26